MKFYYCYYTIYHNGTRINSRHGKCLYDTKPFDKTIPITWRNLNEIYQSLDFLPNFIILNMKKGRVISFFHDKLFPAGNFRDVKEWKHPNLNILLKITYAEYTPSIAEVLKWHDQEKAIAYLRERGLNI